MNKSLPPKRKILDMRTVNPIEKLSETGESFGFSSAFF
jgi:hypothetical protein